jgi:hypothetical protein
MPTVFADTAEHDGRYSEGSHKRFSELQVDSLVCISVGIPVTEPTGGGPDRKSPVLIPKGVAVAFSVYSMHRRPDLYGMDAELFRPERWDEKLPMNQDPTNAKWGYLPFNGGPRICLGCKLIS